MKSMSLRTTLFRFPVALGLAGLLWITATGVHAEETMGTLIWNNGESLKGNFASSDGETLGWQSELFEGPIVLKLPMLRRVEFTRPDEMTKEPFAVFLNDGSRLHCDITALDGETMTLQSRRHGMVRVKRAAIIGIRRMAGSGVIYAGPCGATGWTAVDDPQRGGQPSDPPKAGRGGVLVAPGWNHRTALNVALPERMDIEFSLKSTEMPAFGLSIGTEEAPLSVQTWGDEVVLLWGSHFVSLARLAAEEKSVSLRVIWDRQKARCRVFKGDGSPLCDWQNDPKAAPKKDTATPPAKEAGAAKDNPLGLLAQALFSLATGNVSNGKSSQQRLALQNRGRDLTLERMVVRQWNGKEPQQMGAGAQSVTLAEGTTAGALNSIAGGSVTLKMADGTNKSIPLEQIDGAEFGAARLNDRGPSPAELWAADGSLIVGKLAGVGDNSVRLQTGFAEEPLTCPTSAIKRLNLDVPVPPNTPEEPPLNKMDRLVWATTTLHGAWSALGDARLHWLPVGGVGPVAVKETRNIEITRATPPDSSPSAASSLFHLSTGDIVPGSLTSMDEENVGIEAPLLGIKQIPTSLLRAVQFTGPVESKGFRDKAWQMMQGGGKKVERTDSKITLQPGAAFGHPLMMQADEVSFSLMGEQRSYTSVRVRMFTAGESSRSSEARLIIGHYGNRIYAGPEENEGMLNNRCQVNIASNEAVKIKLVPHAKDVEFFINGASMLKLPSDAQKRKGAGIIFEPCSLWGNGEYAVVIADFAAVSNPGRAWLPGVDELARTQALLIPRFRKETPPHHVLIAPNGDLLRGDLLAGTNSHFSFRVGLDTYQIPRDRVTTAIWLQKPPPEKKDPPDPKDKMAADGDTKPVAKTAEATSLPNPPAQDPSQAKTAAEASANARKPTHWLQLLAGARFALAVEKIDGDAVIGQSEMFGRCHIPFSTIYRIRNTSPGADIVTRAFDSWKLEYAPEPEIPGAGGGDSPLLGKEAPDFTLPTVSGDKFQLRELRGKIVVLDFWATWCAPCVRSMPNMIEAMAPFPPDKVQFIGVNRGENAAQVKKFLGQRGWKVQVALDGLEKVSLQYGVDGIPHTVIIGADGKVAWANTGDNSPSLVPDAIRKLLDAKH